MLLSELLERAGRKALRLQHPTGAFPAGHNGPYNDPETPARNTAHWIILLTHLHERHGDADFEHSVRQAVEYLLSDAMRPGRYTFICRTNPMKDACNGLMGQAWIVEALAVAGHHFNESTWIRTAEEVFHVHPFDPDRSVWRMVEPDGRRLRFDPTFNHQLWFAAAGALLADACVSARDSVQAFLDAVHDRYLRVARNGRIRHVLWMNQRNFLRHPVRTFRVRRAMPAKELGYHSFNLYAFALLHAAFTQHPIWDSPTFRSTLDYLDTREYRAGVDGNPYAFPYNPPGFEVAFAKQTFCRASSDDIRWWIQRQVDFGYDPATELMTRGSSDPATAAARLYEAVRLRDVEVSSSESHS
jgi:hypothetical protein